MKAYRFLPLMFALVTTLSACGDKGSDTGADDTATTTEADTDTDTDADTDTDVDADTDTDTDVAV